MKTRAIVGAFLLAAALVIWFSMSSCETGDHLSGATGDSGDTKHNVVIQELGILIPGTVISKDDAGKMNAILEKYQKNIYKLKTYKNASLTRTAGNLEDLVMDSEMISAMAANVKKHGFAQFAVQLGIGTNAHRSVPGPGPVGGTGTNAHLVAPAVSPVGGTGTNAHLPRKGTGTNVHLQAERESEELVKRLKPILEKYSKK